MDRSTQSISISPEKQDCDNCEYWRRQCQNAVKALELSEGEREYTQAQHRLVRLRQYRLPLENFQSLINAMIYSTERNSEYPTWLIEELREQEECNRSREIIMRGYENETGCY